MDGAKLGLLRDVKKIEDGSGAEEARERARLAKLEGLKKAAAGKLEAEKKELKEMTGEFKVQLESTLKEAKEKAKGERKEKIKEEMRYYFFYIIDIYLVYSKYRSRDILNLHARKSGF